MVKIILADDDIHIYNAYALAIKNIPQVTIISRHSVDDAIKAIEKGWINGTNNRRHLSA